MDACAPAPSCGNNSQNASNVWFKFLPTGATATISCFQNSSFVIGVQAFSGGPVCGSLTEIGCSLAGGPSGGVQLNLSGLNPGTLYYFRIFGDANPVSQRSGIYCFCGTTGLSSGTLPAVLTGFQGREAGHSIELEWSLLTGNSQESFTIERSTDGISFLAVSQVPGLGMLSSPQPYRFTDASPVSGNNYYRIKHIWAIGQYAYSDIILIKTSPVKGFTAYFNPGGQELQVYVADPTPAVLYDVAGRSVQSFRLQPGNNRIPTGQLEAGVYFVRALKTGTTQKCYLSR
jgi:hypothetical protein